MTSPTHTLGESAAIYHGATSRQPKSDVSVIIPSHNRPALLQEALASVLEQTVLPAEIIIVDDASDPPACLPTNENRVTLRMLRHDQVRGGAAAKNTGAQAAQHELIAFLDDDDLWAPNYLEHAMAVLTKHQNIDVLFMGVDWFGKNAETSQKFYQQAMNQVLTKANPKPLDPGVLGFGPQLVGALLPRVPMAFQRPVTRRAFFQRIGGYLEHCLLWDCDWALRAALDGKVALSEASLYRQRVSNQGYTSHPAREKEQTLSAIEIRERLGARLAENDAATRIFRHAFKQSARQHSFYLAYQLQRQGDTWAALKAWVAGQQYAPQPGRVKLLLRILFSSVYKS